HLLELFGRRLFAVAARERPGGTAHADHHPAAARDGAAVHLLERTIAVEAGDAAAGEHHHAAATAAGDFGPQVLVREVKQDLDVGAHLHGLHVALERRLETEGLQSIKLLVADGLARRREDLGGLAHFLGDERDGLREGYSGREREWNECFVIHATH